MSQLHLPARHTDEDLALAGSLAQLLHSGELYVAWSTDGGAAKPVIPATVHGQVDLPESPVIHADSPAPAPVLEAPAITFETSATAKAKPKPAGRRRGGLLQRLRDRRRR